MFWRIAPVQNRSCMRVALLFCFMFFMLCCVCARKLFEPLGLPSFSCCNHIKPAFNILRAVQAAADRRERERALRSLGRCSRGRSRSRSRSAKRAKRRDERFAAPKGRFLQWWEHDSKDAAPRKWRCFNPQCTRVWTTSPYCLWVHFSCTATECIAYLHEETARIQTELQSLDSKEREGIRSMKCSGR